MVKNKQNQPLTLSDLYADNVVYSSRPLMFLIHG